MSFSSRSIQIPSTEETQLLSTHTSQEEEENQNPSISRNEKIASVAGFIIGPAIFLAIMYLVSPKTFDGIFADQDDPVSKRLIPFALFLSAFACCTAFGGCTRLLSKLSMYNSNPNSVTGSSNSSNANDTEIELNEHRV